MGTFNRNGDAFAPGTFASLGAAMYSAHATKEAIQDTFNRINRYGFIDYSLRLPDAMLDAEVEHQMIADAMLGMTRIATAQEVQTEEGRISIGFEMMTAIDP